jgi:iron complex outermembrane receptor protein
MLQGEASGVSSGRSDFRPQTVAPFVWQNLDDEVSIGGDVLARWQHETGENANWALQFFWDSLGRQSEHFDNVNAINVNHPLNVKVVNFRADTYDLDFQRQFPLPERQKFIYGLGYRQVDTFFAGTSGDGGFAIGSNPAFRTLTRYAAFLQDEFTLVDDQWYFTAGSKFERNTFAGFQCQPTGRLLWTPTARQSVWGAVSRAVRIPTASENAISVTGFTASPGVFVQTRGNPNLAAEDVMAYELGYRAQPTDEFSLDTALFYNVYDNLVGSRTGAPIPGPPLIIPAILENVLSAETYGIELAANWKLTDTWRLQANYSFLKLLVHSDPGINPSLERSTEGQSPQHQVYLQSS